MDSLPYVDTLFKEYLLFRGFTATLQSFTSELAADRCCGFQAEALCELIFGQLLPQCRTTPLMELLELLADRLYSQLDGRFEGVVERMEVAVIKAALVTCVRAGRQDKVSEFFRRHGDTLLAGPEAGVWRQWAALAFVPTPRKDPTFQAYFNPEWMSLLEVSFRNFLSQVMAALPLPAVLRFNADRRQRLALQQQVDSLQRQVESLTQRLAAAQTSAAAAQAAATTAAANTAAAAQEAPRHLQPQPQPSIAATTTIAAAAGGPPAGGRGKADAAAKAPATVATATVPGRVAPQPLTSPLHPQQGPAGAVAPAGRGDGGGGAGRTEGGPCGGGGGGAGGGGDSGGAPGIAHHLPGADGSGGLAAAPTAPGARGPALPAAMTEESRGAGSGTQGLEGRESGPGTSSGRPEDQKRPPQPAQAPQGPQPYSPQPQPHPQPRHGRTLSLEAWHAVDADETQVPSAVTATAAGSGASGATAGSGVASGAVSDAVLVSPARAASREAPMRPASSERPSSLPRVAEEGRELAPTPVTDGEVTAAVAESQPPPPLSAPEPQVHPCPSSPRSQLDESLQQQPREGALDGDVGGTPAAYLGGNGEGAEEQGARAPELTRVARREGHDDEADDDVEEEGLDPGVMLVSGPAEQEDDDSSTQTAPGMRSSASLSSEGGGEGGGGGGDDGDGDGSGDDDGEGGPELQEDEDGDEAEAGRATGAQDNDALDAAGRPTSPAGPVSTSPGSLGPPSTSGLQDQIRAIGAAASTVTSGSAAAMDGRGAARGSSGGGLPRAAVVGGGRWACVATQGVPPGVLHGRGAAVLATQFSPGGGHNVATGAADGSVAIWPAAGAAAAGAVGSGGGGQHSGSREARLACGGPVTCVAWDARADKVMLVGTAGSGFLGWHADTRRVASEIPADPAAPWVLQLACSRKDPVFIVAAATGPPPGSAAAAAAAAADTRWWFAPSASSSPSSPSSWAAATAAPVLSAPSSLSPSSGSTTSSALVAASLAASPGGVVPAHLVPHRALIHRNQPKYQPGGHHPHSQAHPHHHHHYQQQQQQQRQQQPSLGGIGSSSVAAGAPSRAHTGRLSLWNMRAFRRVGHYVVPQESPVLSLAYNAQGSWFAAGTSCGAVHLYDSSPSISRPQPLSSFRANVPPPGSAAPAPASPAAVQVYDNGSETVLVTCCGATVRLWSLRRLADPLLSVPLLPYLPHFSGSAGAGGGSSGGGGGGGWSSDWVPCMSLSPRGAAAAVVLGGGSPAVFVVDLQGHSGGGSGQADEASGAGGGGSSSWLSGVFGSPSPASTSTSPTGLSASSSAAALSAAATALSAAGRVSVIVPYSGDGGVGGGGMAGLFQRTVEVEGAVYGTSCSWHPSRDAVVVGYSDGAVQTLGLARGAFGG